MAIWYTKEWKFKLMIVKGVFKFGWYIGSDVI
jgi:hypothetical protein